MHAKDCTLPFPMTHLKRRTEGMGAFGIVQLGTFGEIRHMITYSVTVTLEKGIEQDWLQWMQETHIPDVMATGCFLNARLTRLLDPPPDKASATFNVQYTCDNLGVFKRYQDQHAPALQLAHKSRYDGKFAAFRTILRHEADF